MTKRQRNETLKSIKKFQKIREKYEKRLEKLMPNKTPEYRNGYVDGLVNGVIVGGFAVGKSFIDAELIKTTKNNIRCPK